MSPVSLLSFFIQPTAARCSCLHLHRNHSFKYLHLCSARAADVFQCSFTWPLSSIWNRWSPPHLERLFSKCSQSPGFPPTSVASPSQSHLLASLHWGCLSNIQVEMPSWMNNSSLSHSCTLTTLAFCSFLSWPSIFWSQNICICCPICPEHCSYKETHDLFPRFMYTTTYISLLWRDLFWLSFDTALSSRSLLGSDPASFSS